MDSSAIRKQAEHHWRFFRQWMRAPLSTASVVPSSRFLAERMVAEVPLHARNVIELGAGTGVFTRALLARGAPLEEVMVVELSGEMVQALQKEITGARIVHGDAQELPKLVQETQALKIGEVDGIVSGLGLLNMPQHVVDAILRGSFAVLRQGAPFVQFTYGPKSPIPDRMARELNLDVHRASFTLRNFPPASVYVARQIAAL